MNCHMCGRREATVHLLELKHGQQKSLWLCDICAAGRTDLAGDELVDRVFGTTGGEPGESASLASFLGQVFEADAKADRIAACPQCHYEFKQFQDSNRLGCAACYPHFRAQVLPLLARFHRHASHLGKVPQQAAGMASYQGEITRVRVALEKAIQGEDYEEAGRLRDKMRAMVVERDRLKDTTADDGGLPS